MKENDGGTINLHMALVGRSPLTCPPRPGSGQLWGPANQVQPPTPKPNRDGRSEQLEQLGSGQPQGRRPAWPGLQAHSMLDTALAALLLRLIFKKFRVLSAPPSLPSPGKGSRTPSSVLGRAPVLSTPPQDQDSSSGLAPDLRNDLPGLTSGSRLCTHLQCGLKSPL